MTCCRHFLPTAKRRKLGQVYACLDCFNLFVCIEEGYADHRWYKWNELSHSATNVKKENPL